MLAGVSPTPTPYFWKALKPPKPCALAALVLKVLANEPCPASCSDLPPTSPCPAHNVTWRLHVESTAPLPRCAARRIPSADAHTRKCVARRARAPERALGSQPQRAVCASRNRGCATAPMTRNAPYGCLNWTGHAMPLASCPRAASKPSTRPPQGDAWPPLTSSPSD